MKKLVILQFDGDFSTGYKVTLEVGDDGERPDVRKRGELPPALDVVRSFQEWRNIYGSKHGQSRIKVNAVKNFQTVEYKQQCEQYSQQLLSLFNAWLESESFNSISNYLSELNTNKEQELRIILSCDRLELRKLPWHLWDLWSGAEVALSAPDAARGVRILREKIRILIILGDSTGINVKADEMLLQKYCRDAEIVTLVEPSRENLNSYLQDEIGWDILFFSGHSQTHSITDTSEERAVQGRIFVNKKDSLTMAQLRDSLQTAIQQRLQLAIFNSCDGLGIAAELESLQIPQVIVMREPVPDFVAQEFLKYFLEAFTNGRSLCNSVGDARKQLALLEDDFPCASWLPVIVQNQLEMPPTWQSLGVTRSPYRGLMPFREEDADNFFGREAFIEQLVIDVNRKPLVAVIGASGSGKSSVVFAGLIPQLRLDENTQWRIISFRPGKNPFESLAVALMGSGEIGENQRYQELELEVELKQDMSALANIIADMSGDGSRVLLVVDQFEEIYTLCSKVEERQIFIDGLLNVCTGELEKQEDKQPFPLTVTVVMTLRADFLGKAMSYQPLGKALQDFPPSLLVPMSRAELERAIIKPAARFSVELEEGLVNKLIDDVGAGEGSLPLQQFALTQLWGKQRPGLLTHQAYTEIGGVTQAVANHAEAVYAGLSGEEQKRAQRLFIQLVQPGEGTEDTRRLATRDEVGDYWDLVTLLANERLLVTNRNELVEDTVEVVHEALIRNWGRLREWMDDNREFRVWQERLKVALQQWVDSNKDDGDLLRSATLAVAEDWLQKRGEEVSKPQRWFIEKSVGLRERERKQKERLRRRVIGGLAAGLVLALSLAGFAGWQWREVQVRETNAQLIAGSLSAEKLLTSNNDLEALIQGVKTGKKLRSSKWVNTDTRIQTVATLAQVVYGAKELNRLQADTPWYSTSICFSPNGEIIASGGMGKIQLWNRQGKILKDIQAEGDFFDRLSFNPDGKILASGDRGKIQFWNQHGEKLYSFKADSYFSFSSDGRTIASSDSTHIKLWNLEGKLIQSFQVSKTKKDLHIPPIKFSFSPDGKNIATLDEKGIKIWNLRGENLQTFNQDISWGGKFSVSPDRKKTAFINQEDETIELDMMPLKEGFRVNGKIDASRVYAVMFSQDAKTLASAHDYGDLTIKIWDLQGKELQTFKNNLCSSFRSPILDPSGHIVARLMDDSERISISNLKSRTIPTLDAEIASINAIRFSSDNKIISVNNVLSHRIIQSWDFKQKLTQRYQVDNTALPSVMRHTRLKYKYF
jgi:CHAT domain/WD domain, G-beta repeat